MNEIELRNKIKRNRIIIALLLLITIIGIGYASLGANLQINGTTKITDASWDVRFKADSINVTTGSVEVDTNAGGKSATIDTLTEVSYNVNLALPGDFYEFTVVAKNAGTIDAMIDSVVSKLGNTVITNDTLPSYLKYSVTYSDGVAISPNHLLAAGSEETIKVRLEYDKEVEADELPTTDQSLSLNFQIFYAQADENAISVPHS